MTGLRDQLASNRAARSAARGAFDAKLAQVQADLAARGIGGRVADTASAEIKDALGEAAAIARESKGVIAATGAALALWLLRAPLIAFAERRLASRRKTADVQAD